MGFRVTFLIVAAIFCGSCMSNDSSANQVRTVGKNCSVVECINHGNGDISSAILCNDCVAKIVCDKDLALRFYEIQSEMMNKSNVKHTTFSDLNLDCVLMIHDELNLLDKVNFLTAYPVKALIDATKNRFRMEYKDYR